MGFGSGSLKGADQEPRRRWAECLAFGVEGLDAKPLIPHQVGHPWQDEILMCTDLEKVPKTPNPQPYTLTRTP